MERVCVFRINKSRSIRGAWIETYDYIIYSENEKGRAPYGARGLKHVIAKATARPAMSRSIRGAWIETSQAGPRMWELEVALHTGRVD